MRIFFVLAFLQFSNSVYAQIANCNYTITITNKLGQAIPCDSSFCFFDTQDTVIYFEINKDFKNKNANKINYGIFKRDKSTYLEKYFFELENYKNSIDIKTLQSGNYQLRIINFDSTNKKQCVSFLNFQKFNNIYLPVEKPKDTVNTLLNTENIANTFVEKYSSAELSRFVPALIPIATPAEQRIIGAMQEQSDTMSVKRFFYNFWANRNSSKPQESWKQYAALLNETAKKYGTLTKKGYQTDRGRVYLKYGKPDYDIQVNAEEGTKPYEVWQYASVENGKYSNVIFLFAQMSSNMNDIQVIHCTAPIDVQNQYWQSIVFLPNYDPTKNYRIYEFFEKQ